MYSEARKLELIESVLKTKDEAILFEIENVFIKKQNERRNAFADLAGLLTDEEADAMSKAIHESCEQIDANDWK